MRPIDADEINVKRWFVFPDNRKTMTEALKAAPTLSLNTLRDAIYTDAVEHGLWEDVDKAADNFAEMQLSSVREEMPTRLRRNAAAGAVLNEADELYEAAENEDWDGMQEELADVVIQALSTAGYLGIDIDAAVRWKMEINKGRPWKHGK